MYLARLKTWGEQRAGRLIVNSPQTPSSRCRGPSLESACSAVEPSGSADRGDERISQALGSGGLGRQGRYASVHASGGDGGGMEWVQNNVKLRT